MGSLLSGSGSEFHEDVCNKGKELMDKETEESLLSEGEWGRCQYCRRVWPFKDLYHCFSCKGYYCEECAEKHFGVGLVKGADAISIHDLSSLPKPKKLGPQCRTRGEIT